MNGVDIMTELARLSLSLEQPLLQQLNQMTEEEGYRNRSEFIRDLIRDHKVKKQWESQEEVLGTLTIIFDHHQPELTRKLTDLQHDFPGKVLAATHVHISHHICAEMIMLSGLGSEIQTMTNTIRSLRGILHAELALGTTGHGII